jgi:hypothetical protein
LKIAQAAVGDRADAARAAAEKSAERRLDDRRGIAAQLPADLARFVFERAQAHAGLANGDAIRLNLSMRSMRAEVEHHAALQSGTAWP